MGLSGVTKRRFLMTTTINSALAWFILPSAGPFLIKSKDGCRMDESAKFYVDFVDHLYYH